MSAGASEVFLWSVLFTPVLHNCARALGLCTWCEQLPGVIIHPPQPTSENLGECVIRTEGPAPTQSELVGLQTTSLSRFNTLARGAEYKRWVLRLRLCNRVLLIQEAKRELNTIVVTRHQGLDCINSCEHCAAVNQVYYGLALGLPPWHWHRNRSQVLGAVR